MTVLASLSHVIPAPRHSKRRIFLTSTDGISVALSHDGSHAAMIYSMIERSLLAAIMSLGSLFANRALRKQRKSLVAVRRHRPEP